MIDVRAGVDVSGQVCREDGTAVRSALVDCSNCEWDKLTCGSDENGMFLLRSVATGWRTIRARQGDVGSGSANVFVSESGLGTGVQVILTRGQEITGCVVDEGSVPIANVRIHGQAIGEKDFGYKCLTDNSGKFVLRGAPASGLHRLWVYSPAYKEAELEEAELQAGEVRVVLVKREVRRGAIVGCVTDSRGLPMNGAEVVAMKVNDKDGCQAATDKDGRFRIDVVIGAYAVAVRSNEHVWPDNIDVSVEQDGLVDLGQIRLDRGARVIVRFSGPPPVEEIPGAGYYRVVGGDGVMVCCLSRIGAEYVSRRLGPGHYWLEKISGGRWAALKRISIRVEDCIVTLAG